jgi:GR25 family glycosyltransferase involved in LPS biosynthesis
MRNFNELSRKGVTTLPLMFSILTILFLIMRSQANLCVEPSPRPHAAFRVFFERNYRVYYINMETSTHRRTKMEHMLGFLGDRLVRIPGVNVSMDILPGLLSHTLEATASSAHPVPVNKTSVRFSRLLGCSLSHLRLYQQAIKDNVDVALVLEDDIVLDLVPIWTLTLEHFIDFILPDEWSIAQLSITAGRDKFAELKRRGTRTYLKERNTTGVWGTLAYLISKKGIHEMLQTYASGQDTRFDLSIPPCIEADDCILPYGVQPGTFHVATPPWFTNDPLGDTLMPGQDTALHTTSYHESVMWNFDLWKSTKIFQGFKTDIRRLVS